MNKVSKVLSLLLISVFIVGCGEGTKADAPNDNGTVNVENDKDTTSDEEVVVSEVKEGDNVQIKKERFWEDSSVNFEVGYSTILSIDSFSLLIGVKNNNKDIVMPGLRFKVEIIKDGAVVDTFEKETTDYISSEGKWEFIYSESIQLKDFDDINITFINDIEFYKQQQ